MASIGMFQDVKNAQLTLGYDGGDTANLYDLQHVGARLTSGNYRTLFQPPRPPISGALLFPQGPDDNAKVLPAELLQ